MSYSTSGDAQERTGAQTPPVEPLPRTETSSQQTETSSQGTETGPDGTAGTTKPSRGEVPRTRTALAHNSLLAGTIILILLLVFILENTQSVKISYFGASFRMPLGVALLLAAIGGALVVGIVGTARIVQLRRRVRHPR